MTIYSQKDDVGNEYLFNDAKGIDDPFHCNNPNVNDVLQNMVDMGVFIALDGEQYEIKKQPMKFFKEFIPLAFQFKENIKQMKP